MYNKQVYSLRANQSATEGLQCWHNWKYLGEVDYSEVNYYMITSNTMIEIVVNKRRGATLRLQS